MNQLFYNIAGGIVHKIRREKRTTMSEVIEGFTVADVILVVGQTRQNLQWMYGKNRDFDAR